MKLKPSWIVIHDGTGLHPYRLECQRCGKTQDTAMPVEVAEFIASGQEFVNQHKSCEHGARLG